MASVADRWHTMDRMSGSKVRTARYGKGRRWQVRYRDPSGESRNRSFERKADAERFLVQLSSELMRGEYVDPRAGEVTFASYARSWLERQALEPTSIASMELRIRVHMTPTWGARSLLNIQPVDVQRWVRELQDGMAPSYVRLIFVNFSAILASAVEEGRLARNPCKAGSVRLPAVPRRRVVPWTIERVLAVIEAHPARYQALVAVAAACGLRQGECFGLRGQDVDFLRGELHVRQQIRLVASCPTPALPKYGRTRTVPLPIWLSEVLVRHICSFSPLPGERTHAPGVGGLLFYGREGKPLNRNYFNPNIWRPALASSGVPSGGENGMHALRHACASTWLEHGVSIKAVSEYLGHADPGFTLRVYTHVMPSSGERARNAMDAAFEEGRRPRESASTGGALSAHESTPRVGN